MSGQINSALRCLSGENGGGVLSLTDDVMKQLREKHPEAQEAHLGTLVFGPTEQVPASIFQQINEEMVREAALKTKGSGSPSGVDSNGFRRMMASVVNPLKVRHKPLLRYCYYDEKAMHRVCGSSQHRSYSS